MAMSYGRIDAQAFSFNALLLMDTWIIRYISHKKDPEFNRKLAIALAANPVVCWYFESKCPDHGEYYSTLAESAPTGLSPEQVRECEIYLLGALETFIVYLYPAIMDELPYIKTWDKKRLLSTTDFTGKTVRDIGGGAGRGRYPEPRSWDYPTRPPGAHTRKTPRPQPSRPGWPRPARWGQPMQN